MFRLVSGMYYMGKYSEYVSRMFRKRVPNIYSIKYLTGGVSQKIEKLSHPYPLYI